jgi:hypothetical protein
VRLRGLGKQQEIDEFIEIWTHDRAACSGIIERATLSAPSLHLTTSEYEQK